MLRKAPHMELIDNQIAHLIKGIRRVSPVKIILDHPGVVEAVPLLALSPDALSGHRPGVRVEKHVFLIEKQALLRIPGAVQPVGVLELLDIQAEDNHGIDLANPVMSWKFQDRVGLFLFPVI